MGSDGAKLRSKSKAHKPADSGVAVGNGARFCSLSDVTRRLFKHSAKFAFSIYQNITTNPVGAGLPAIAACQATSMLAVLWSSLASLLPQGFVVVVHVMNKPVFMTLLFQSTL
jgi:hypothetical protein